MHHYSESLVQDTNSKYMVIPREHEKFGLAATIGGFHLRLHVGDSHKKAAWRADLTSREESAIETQF